MAGTFLSFEDSPWGGVRRPHTTHTGVFRVGREGSSGRGGKDRKKQKGRSVEGRVLTKIRLGWLGPRGTGALGQDGEGHFEGPARPVVKKYLRQLVGSLGRWSVIIAERDPISWRPDRLERRAGRKGGIPKTEGEANLKIKGDQMHQKILLKKKA